MLCWYFIWIDLRRPNNFLCGIMRWKKKWKIMWQSSCSKLQMEMEMGRMTPRNVAALLSVGGQKDGSQRTKNAVGREAQVHPQHHLLPNPRARRQSLKVPRTHIYVRLVWDTGQRYMGHDVSKLLSVMFVVSRTQKARGSTRRMRRVRNTQKETTSRNWHLHKRKSVPRKKRKRMKRRRKRKQRKLRKRKKRRWKKQKRKRKKMPKKLQGK